MPSSRTRVLLYLVSILIIVIFCVWMEVDPYGLAPQTHEDHWIENLTAIGYAVGGLFFAIAAWRVPLLRKNARAWAPVMTICWALIGFFCAGEEISWGQRIFHITSPAYFQKDSTQDEINLHNLRFIEDSPILSEYRALSIYMLFGGFFIPVFARTKPGRALVGHAYFPILPWCYSALWVGAYFYGKYFVAWNPIPDLIPSGAPTEIREMMVALGTAFFGFHTLVWPTDVYLGNVTKGRKT
jgi:hypothetical protein